MGVSVLNIRESVWQEMNDKEQQALIEAASIGLARIIYSYQDEENEVKELAKQEGINFVEVSDSMKQQREEFMQSQLERAAETATGRGVENAGQIVESFTKNLEKWENLLFLDLMPMVAHGAFGDIPMPRFPGADLQAGELTPAPGLGEHTCELLRESGYSQNEIDSFLASEVCIQAR